MKAPRLEIDLDKVRHNARTLVDLLAVRGISVTGVTKAVLGSTDVARTLLQAGVTTLGDSRIDNIEAMRRAGVPAQMTLIRSPMLSQADRVVASADISFNTEFAVIRALSRSAKRANLRHGIVLMIELGDLREGIMPDELDKMMRQIIRLPNIDIKGIGANLACRNGISPDTKNMSELSTLASSLEATYGLTMEMVSGGNSANIDWACNAEDVGRVNNLRLGESILLGREPLHRRPIDGLHTDAITLVAEVIESKVKPTQPWGEVAQAAFEEQPPAAEQGDILQTILALGHQDTDPLGLGPPAGSEILGASSDHLVVGCPGRSVAVGAEMTFQLNYSALLRASTSPFVTTVVKPPEQAPCRGPNDGVADRIAPNAAAHKRRQVPPILQHR